jgi:uncharacterized tellurite resistance protein B-like protein
MEFKNTEEAKTLIRQFASLAYADGEFDPRERKLIEQLGRRKGLTEQDIYHAIESCRNDDSASLKKINAGLAFVVNLFRVALADGEISTEEISKIISILEDAGYTQRQAKELVIVAQKHLPERAN